MTTQKIKIRCALEEPLHHASLFVCHIPKMCLCLVKTVLVIDSNRHLLSFHKALQTPLQEI